MGHTPTVEWINGFPINDKRIIWVLISGNHIEAVRRKNKRVAIIDAENQLE